MNRIEFDFSRLIKRLNRSSRSLAWKLKCQMWFDDIRYRMVMDDILDDIF